MAPCLGGCGIYSLEKRAHEFNSISQHFIKCVSTSVPPIYNVGLALYVTVSGLKCSYKKKIINVKNKELKKVEYF